MRKGSFFWNKPFCGRNRNENTPWNALWQKPVPGNGTSNGGSTRTHRRNQDGVSTGTAVWQSLLASKSCLARQEFLVSLPFSQQSLFSLVCLASTWASAFALWSIFLMHGSFFVWAQLTLALYSSSSSAQCLEQWVILQWILMAQKELQQEPDPVWDLSEISSQWLTLTQNPGSP